MLRHAKTTSTYLGDNVTRFNVDQRIIDRVKASLARLGIHGFRPKLDRAASLLEALRTPEGVTIPGKHVGRAPARHGPTSLRQAADQGDETTRAKRLAQAPSAA